MQCVWLSLEQTYGAYFKGAPAFSGKSYIPPFSSPLPPCPFYSFLRVVQEIQEMGKMCPITHFNSGVPSAENLLSLP